MVTKFLSGIHLMTCAVALKAAEDPDFAQFVWESKQRHLNGDWGDLCAEDKAENELSLKQGFRLLSAYEKEGLPKIWVITESDRSATTVLFPDDY